MMQQSINKIFFFIFFAISFNNAPAIEVFTKAQEENFIQKYAHRYQIPEDYIRIVLHQATYEPASDQLKPPVSSIITIADSRRKWEHYRGQFIYPAMINTGARFMCVHKDAIRKAGIDFGVPPEIILGILGVETAYGKNVGHLKVLDVLATIAFNTLHRVHFFQDELAKYILMCYKNKWNPTAMKGSIDGAFGMAQFMPSSYLDYAISYTGEIPDLMIADDAIMSIGNYIKQHGWQKGAPVYLNVNTNPATCQQLNCPTQAIAYDLSTWLNSDIAIKRSFTIDPSNLSRVVSVTNLANHPAWLVLDNFFTIFSYNHSTYYALTIYQLGTSVVSRANELGCKL
ncbi:MAG: lytic murein transglycosylase [Burkholderiales bacterium]|jgi:membrane-bound lytic murein transglycosylase B|nr:lytic murein transglycosylase [Burkholderiales bacterium]